MHLETNWGKAFLDGGTTWELSNLVSCMVLLNSPHNLSRRFISTMMVLVSHSCTKRQTSPGVWSSWNHQYTEHLEYRESPCQKQLHCGGRQSHGHQDYTFQVCQYRHQHQGIGTKRRADWSSKKYCGYLVASQRQDIRESWSRPWTTLLAAQHKVTTAWWAFFLDLVRTREGFLCLCSLGKMFLPTPFWQVGGRGLAALLV